MSAIRGREALAGGGFALCNQRKIVACIVQRHQDEPAEALLSEHITLHNIGEMCCMSDVLDGTDSDLNLKI